MRNRWPRSCGGSSRLKLLKSQDAFVRQVGGGQRLAAELDGEGGLLACTTSGVGGLYRQIRLEQASGGHCHFHRRAKTGGMHMLMRAPVFADPTGCVTTLWEPDEFVGCGVMSEVGAFAWSEHLSTDRAASVRFFEEGVGVETATADRELTPSHPSKSTPPVGRPLPRFHRIHRLPRVQRSRAVRYSCSLRPRQRCSTRRRLQQA